MLLEKHKLSHTIKKEADTIDDKYHISSKTAAIGKAAGNTAAQIDEKYKISEKATMIKESVSTAAKKV